MNWRSSNMRLLFILIFFLAAAILALQAHPQQIPSGGENKALVLDRIIPTPSIRAALIT